MELTQKIGHRCSGFVDWLGNGDTICKVTIFLPIISITQQINFFLTLFSGNDILVGTEAENTIGCYR
jgi:hypothetical protein